MDTKWCFSMVLDHASLPQNFSGFAPNKVLEYVGSVIRVRFRHFEWLQMDGIVQELALLRFDRFQLTNGIEDRIVHWIARAGTGFLLFGSPDWMTAKTDGFGAPQLWNNKMFAGIPDK